MNKHTPGPWVYEDAPLSEGEYTPHGYIHAELDGNSIVTLGEVWGSSETQQANGRLIAAAPELYDVLKNIVSQNCPVCSRKSDDCTYCRAVDLAIAKAEGK